MLTLFLDSHCVSLTLVSGVIGILSVPYIQEFEVYRCAYIWTNVLKHFTLSFHTIPFFFLYICVNYFFSNYEMGFSNHLSVGGLNMFVNLLGSRQDQSRYTEPKIKFMGLK